MEIKSFEISAGMNALCRVTECMSNNCTDCLNQTILKGSGLTVEGHTPWNVGETPIRGTEEDYVMFVLKHG